MESLCGVFQPLLIPEWFSKSGPGFAAIVALVIYILGRVAVQRDARKRRKVLHAMLHGHVLRAIEICRPALNRLDELGRNISDVHLRLFMASLRMDGAKRMTELQRDLMLFGGPGDVDLALFIESCRQFVDSHAGWSEQIKEKQTFVDENGYPFALIAMRAAIGRVLEHANAAEEVVGREAPYKNRVIRT